MADNFITSGGTRYNASLVNRNPAVARSFGLALSHHLRTHNMELT